MVFNQEVIINDLHSSQTFALLNGIFYLLYSGGIQRDWVGFPRSLYSADSKNIRCACTQEADLNDSLLKEYPNCPKDATSCMLPK